MSIEEIVKGLKEQGMEDEAVKAALQEMLEKGEITEEDFQKALELLESVPAEEEQAESEEAYAERLFGI